MFVNTMFSVLFPVAVTDRDVRKRKPAEVLITGSLYLVGATLKILSPCLYD